MPRLLCRGRPRACVTCDCCCCCCCCCFRFGLVLLVLYTTKCSERVRVRVTTMSDDEYVLNVQSHGAPPVESDSLHDILLLTVEDVSTFRRRAIPCVPAPTATPGRLRVCVMHRLLVMLLPPRTTAGVRFRCFSARYSPRKVGQPTIYFIAAHQGCGCLLCSSLFKSQVHLPTSAQVVATGVVPFSPQEVPSIISRIGFSMADARRPFMYFG